VPPARDRRGAARALVLGGALLLAGSQVGLLLEIRPFPTWFYVFAWWAWIALADGAVYLRTGSSLLLSRTRSFVLLLPWSVAFWLFFEAANFVLQNWYYVAVPAGRAERLIGISLSFATVLPGVIETADLLAAFGFLRHRPGPRLVPSNGALRTMFLAGLLFLGLPLLFPELFYPLIWGTTVLCLEPLLFRAGKRGYLTSMARGEYATPLRYLAAGLVCGFLWEFWNHGSEAKWIYTVPGFEELKLFEMPVLGFLGFPPFALEVYTFVRVLVAVGAVPELERDLPAADAPAPPPDGRPQRASLELQLLGVSAAFFFSSLVLPGVERLTVRSTAPVVGELIRDEFQAQVLALAGYDDFDRLVEDLRHDDLRGALSMTVHERDATLREAELMRLAGMGRRGAAWLASVGVYDVDDLAARSADDLIADLEARGDGPGPEPYDREVRVWLRRARARLDAP
jgi:hypothetical protein